MKEILSHPLFRILGIPIILSVIGVLSKSLGRRDGDKNPLRNNWAINTTLLLMALGTVVSDIYKKTTPDEILDGFSIFLGFVLFLFMSNYYDRFASWVPDEEGNPTVYKHIFRGVILPDIVSLSIFGAYQYWVGGK